MSAIAAAIAGAAVVGGVATTVASNKAASAQRDAARTSSDTQLAMYNQTRDDQAPWRSAGGQAVDALSRWYGLGGVNTTQPSQSTQDNVITLPGGRVIRIPGQDSSGSTTTQQPVDYNSILSNLPGYQFQQQQGNQAVQRNLAAAGLLQSGAAGKALQQYGQGVASNYATQYVNGLQSLAGLGQTSVQSTGNIGANTANQIGANQIYSGNAQASGYAGTANAINSGLSGVAGAYGMYNTWQNQGYNNGSYASVMNNGNFGGPNAYGSGYTFEDYGATP